MTLEMLQWILGEGGREGGRERGREGGREGRREEREGGREGWRKRGEEGRRVNIIRVQQWIVHYNVVQDCILTCNYKQGTNNVMLCIQVYTCT